MMMTELVSLACLPRCTRPLLGQPSHRTPAHGDQAHATTRNNLTRALALRRKVNPHNLQDLRIFVYAIEYTCYYTTFIP